MIIKPNVTGWIINGIKTVKKLYSLMYNIFADTFTFLLTDYSLSD